MSRSKAVSSSRLAWYRLTAHPTPKTRSLKSWFESGFQYAARMRSHVGGRKSYGTAPQTLPCHVRSSSGLDSSVATAATTSPITARRSNPRSPRKVRILQLKSSPR